MLRLLAVTLCWVAIATTTAAAQKRVALLIGINDYPRLKTAKDPLNGQLLTSVADAEAMADALGSLGFDVEIGRNVDRVGLLTALERLKRRIAPGDTVFLFFAGHGVAFKGANFLLPADVPAIDPESEQLVRGLAITETDLIEAAREKGAGLTILTLDACRNNPIEELAREQARVHGRAFRSTSMRSVGLETRPTSGVFSIYSAGIGQRALDSLSSERGERNSVFTRVFVRKVRDPGRHLSDIMEEVKEEVARLAATETDPDTGLPHRQYPAFYNETQGGPVYLAGRGPARQPEAKLPPPGPPADEIAWSPLKDTTDVAALRRFVAGFPKSRFNTAAQARIAELEERERRRIAAVSPTQRPPAPPPPIEPAVGIHPRAGAQPLSAAQERSLRPKAVFRECPNCPEMVVMPTGSFLMGSPDHEKGRGRHEGPQHMVTIGKAFAVGRFAVTFEEWDACIAEGGCKSHRPADLGWGRSRLPVINISWDDAKAYVEWLSGKTGKPYRLLTEAEREYVTRAGTTTPFWWGASMSTQQANYNGAFGYDGGPKGDWRRKTVPVETFAANPWGLYQVHGNVEEWVEDCFYPHYDAAPADGSAWTSIQCSRHVLRGGNWYAGSNYLRSASRYGGIKDKRDMHRGFRIARTLVP